MSEHFSSTDRAQAIEQELERAKARAQKMAAFDATRIYRATDESEPQIALRRKPITYDTRTEIPFRVGEIKSPARPEHMYRPEKTRPEAVLDEASIYEPITPGNGTKKRSLRKGQSNYESASFQAIIDDLDELERSFAMRNRPRQEGLAKNPGHTKRSVERDWERASTPTNARVANAEAEAEGSPALRKAFDAAWRQYANDDLSLTTNTALSEYERYIGRNEANKKLDQKVNALEQSRATARENRMRLIYQDIAYQGAREKAKIRGRYPAQKPIEYKDRFGNETIRGWDKNLAKDDIDADEALELELELRELEEMRARKEIIARDEWKREQEREAMMRELDRMQEKLESPDRIPPSRDAYTVNGDADSLSDAKRLDRNRRDEWRLHNERGGKRLAKKPVYDADRERAYKASQPRHDLV